MSGVLHGVRVVEMGTFVTGPAASVLLADLRADTRPAASQAHVLTCRDGKRIALHMSTPPKFWQKLVQATGHTELLQRYPTRESRLGDHAGVIRALQPIFATRDRHAWCRQLAANDAPHAPVYDPSEALEQPAAQCLGLKRVQALPDGSEFVAVRNPVVYDREHPAAIRPPPRLDEHRREILASIPTPLTTNERRPQ